MIGFDTLSFYGKFQPWSIIGIIEFIQFGKIIYKKYDSAKIFDKRNNEEYLRKNCKYVSKQTS